MKRKQTSSSIPEASVLDQALNAMEADELRELIRDILPWLDDRAHTRMINTVIDRAARNENEWTPVGPPDKSVSEAVTFADAARRTGYADPSDVDDYFRQAMNAFLGRNYGAAVQIYRVLLVPIADGGIHLGEHEMVDEVLGVEVSECAVQYGVATYMTSAPARRAEAVRDAIGDVSAMGHLWEPVREMERVAVEPLPGLDDFLPRWRALIEESPRDDRRNDWDTDEDHWLREVVQRMEGANGLAALARSTKRPYDLQAWCRALVETGDWKAALSAYEEAAEIVSDKSGWRGDFYDGVALAAQELGRRDLPKRLEHAWREAPSLLRLRRWLGSSGSRAVLRKRAAAAIEACPNESHRQRALLHVLLGDLTPAAKLLAAAPSLGWSRNEHPGHLLFPLFRRLLGDKSASLGQDTRQIGVRGMDIDELASLLKGGDEPRLTSSLVDELIEIADIGGVADGTERTALIKAMRAAAEKRIHGVTQNKRRRSYDHAASLAAACVALDPTQETTEWMVSIRSQYRRYPALQREFKRHAG